MALPPLPKKYRGANQQELIANIESLFIYLTRLRDLFTDSVQTIAPGGSYTDEQAQDAVGNILLDSNDIDLIYSDVIPSIQAQLIQGTDRVVESSETRLIQNTRSVVVSRYFDIQGVLDLQGDSVLEVL